MASHATAPTSPPPYVSRFGVYLFRGGNFNFVMANFWAAAWLGSDGRGGDRARLGRELDELKAMGVSAVRLLASHPTLMRGRNGGYLSSTDGSPWAVDADSQQQAEELARDGLGLENF